MYVKYMEPGVLLKHIAPESAQGQCLKVSQDEGIQQFIA